MSDQNADLVSADSVAPESQPEPLAPEAVAPESQPEPPAPRKRQYIPCTGKQISTFLRAVEMGMEGAHYASESDVEAFVRSKG